MDILTVLDKKDYEISMPIIKRSAVRGIIIKNGKLLLIKNNKGGEYEFAGGGMEDGETFEGTLIREVFEETGFKVDPRTIKEYGIIIEKNKDRFENAAFEHYSYYFVCDVFDDITKINLDEYEIENGYMLYLIDFDEAIATNNDALKNSPENRDTQWLKRELFMFEHIKENIVFNAYENT